MPTNPASPDPDPPKDDPRETSDSKDHEEPSVTPKETYLLRNYVLHARSWEVGVIGSGKAGEWAPVRSGGGGLFGNGTGPEWSYDPSWDAEIFLYIRICSAATGRVIRRELKRAGGATESHDGKVLPQYRVSHPFEFEDLRSALRSYLDSRTEPGIGSCDLPGSMGTSMQDWLRRYIWAPRRAKAERLDRLRPVLIAENETESLHFELINAWMVLLPSADQRPPEQIWDKILEKTLTNIASGLGGLLESAPGGGLTGPLAQALTETAKEAIEEEFSDLDLPDPITLPLVSARSTRSDPDVRIPELNSSVPDAPLDLDRDPFRDLEPPYLWEGWDLQPPMPSTVRHTRSWYDSMEAASAIIRDHRVLDVAEVKGFWRVNDRQLWLSFMKEWVEISRIPHYMTAFVSIGANIRLHIMERQISAVGDSSD